MATPLDVGLLQKFNVIFPFLLVFVMVYAILSRIEWFKEKQVFALLIAFILSLMTLMSRIAIRTINLMAPWFVLLFLFGVFVLIAYMTFGIKEETIMHTLTKSVYAKDFAYWVLALVLIIGLGSLSYVISTEAGWAGLAGQEPDAEAVGFFATITHPKVLGMVLLLLIAMFTVGKLSQKETI